MNPTTLETLWTSLAGESTPPGGGQLRRRLPISDYDVYLTHERPSRLPGLLVVAAEKPGVLWKRLQNSQGLSIRVDARPGSTPSLQIAERDSRFHEIFVALVADLVSAVETVSKQPSTERPLLMDVLAGRIARWQRCLKEQNDFLSMDSRAGLFGELSVLAAILQAGVNPLVAIEKWTGPGRAVQDFQYESLAIEVKTSRQTQPTKVRIASERQLDTSTHARLVLIHFGLDERSDGSGSTLPAKVAEVRQLVESAPQAELLLNDRLLEGGYLDFRASHYSDVSYALRSVDYFDVVEPMPRLVEQDLPVGIGNVSYDLSLAACEGSRLAQTEVSELLTAIEG